VWVSCFRVSSSRTACRAAACCACSQQPAPTPISVYWLCPYPTLPPERLITSRFVNGNMVRNFPTHGQLSAAQGSPTNCLNFDFAILNLTPRLCSLIDGPEVEHGAHFLILYFPLSVVQR
jgi:hypothetical protein